jgi:hypothetical protein
VICTGSASSLSSSDAGTALDAPRVGLVEQVIRRPPNNST